MSSLEGGASGSGMENAPGQPQGIGEMAAGQSQSRRERRGPPSSLRETYEQFAFFRRDQGMDEFVQTLPLDDMSPRQVYYAAHGRAPDSLATAVFPPEVSAADAYIAALKSREFRENFVPRFLAAFPENRRLFFVHVPKCAGVDLSSYLVSWLPSLKTQVIDPEWAGPNEFFEHIKDLVLEVRFSGFVYVHGHNTLRTYVDWNVFRHEDEIFTVIREPVSRVISQVNYVLTRIFSDAPRIAPDTRAWRLRFGVEDLEISNSSEEVLKLARRCLYDKGVVEPDIICRYLGSGTCDSAIEETAIHAVEITETSRYDEWCRIRWGRRQPTRRNTSRSYIKLGDLTDDDRDYIAAICREDLEFHRLVMDRLDHSGRHSLFGAELVGVDRSARAAASSRARSAEGIEGFSPLRVIEAGTGAAALFARSEDEDRLSPTLEIAFGKNGNSAGYEREGWSGAEAGYTWTAGTQSRLRFPRPAEPGSYRVRVLVRPFIWQDRVPSQRLVLQVNGIECGAVNVARDPALLDCDLPWSVLTASPEVELAWFFPDAVRPSEVKGVEDHRLLAFRFERIELRPIVEPDAHPAQAVPPVDEPDPASAASQLARFSETTGSPQAVPAEPERELADTGPLHLPLGQPAPAMPGSDKASELPDRELMLRFESIGENCEFGLVQRRCGAEPLGLFRFASAPLPKLKAGLEACFEGLSDPDNLDVQLSSNGREYMVYDRKFQLLYHAWVLAEEMTAEAVRQREVRRLPLLIRKLVEDLNQAEKIFIFHGMEPLTDEEARDLLARLRSYGPNTLLWIEPANADHPAGSVEWIGQGLLKGHIDRFAPGDDAHDLSLDCWIAICRNAHGMWQAGAEARGSSARAAAQ